MSETLHHLTAEPAETGLRLDRFLASRLADVSRSRLQALIRDGRLHIAGQAVCDPGRRVKPGERIELVLPAAIDAAPLPEPIPLSVVFEDAHLIVVDKPAGLVVHPAAGHASGTLVNALLAHCGASLSGIGGVRRPGIVHRLDKDTSGLLVVAKTDQAHQGLAQQFAAHGADGRLIRDYLALVWGVPEREQGTVRAALARSQSNRLKIAVMRSGGRAAVTHYRVERVLPGPQQPLVSVVRCRLETGRTHQIRVHMRHIGHPVVGDATYGSGFAASARNLNPMAQSLLNTLNRHALHAATLGFEHPVTGRALRFQSPLPTDLQGLIAALGG